MVSEWLLRHSRSGSHSHHFFVDLEYCQEPEQREKSKVLSHNISQTPEEMYTYYRALIVSAVFLTIAVANAPAQSIGGLSVFPTRIVLEGRERSNEIILTNHSSDTVTYRISFKNMRMNEDGTYEDIESAEFGEAFADNLIRFSPRQVTLGPGSSQTVRLLLRKPADLPPGEYRSHMLFKTVPPAEVGTDIENLEPGEGDLQVRITTVFAITIPVIVVHGSLSATAEFSHVSFHPPDTADESPTLILQLKRSGNRSVYGDITVTFLPDEPGDDRIVGLVRSIAVLHPYPSRTVNLPLSVPGGVTLKHGDLLVTYRATPEDGGAILCDTILKIP